ncbi:MAG: hypothetical protein WA655_17210 [Candidatus Korobacteraceae bacterium]
MSVDVKKAVELARGYLVDLLEVPASDILLEEVDRVGSYWDVTFSFPDRAPNLGRLLGGRTYKVVRLDAEEGGFDSVKIRSIAYDRSA